MRKLETYVNEKLRVTKGSGIPNLISFLESKTKKEFDSKCERLLEYLKNDSDLPIAELEYLKDGSKKLSKKYENTHDTFLWVKEDKYIFYGTWNAAYSLRWSGINNAAKCYNAGAYGFKGFSFYDKELSKSEGIYIITENAELMKQIDYLVQSV